MDENSSTLVFSLFDGIGPRIYHKLLQEFGSSQNIWGQLKSADKKFGVGEKLYARFDQFRKNYNGLEYIEKLAKTKVTYVGYTHPNYPSFLKDLENPPIGLFCKGKSSLLGSKRNIGVVGARKITLYGRDVTEKITEQLVLSGICIVSGMAMGVDATAHKSAFENRGETIAVLGCGVDCPTPEENRDLYEKILDAGGLIVSEYPLGMPPSKGSFPMRNRIIAGLSIGVLVTEAAEDSGSLITADEALKLGRPVFAVPGPITSQMAQGSLKLLKQGARLVSSGEDILQEFKIQSAKFKIESQNLKNLNKFERKVIEQLKNESVPLDLLSKSTQIPIHTLLGIVTGLELKGIITQSNGNVRIV